MGTQYNYEQNAHCFDEEYLRTPSPEVVSSIKWPMPVLWQETKEQLSIGSVAISPGDVLEVIDGSREQFYLVFSICCTKGQEQLLCYATNTEEIEPIRKGALKEVATPPVEKVDTSETPVAGYDIVRSASSEFVVHHNVVDHISDSPVASRSRIEDSPISISQERMRQPSRFYPYSHPPDPFSPDHPRIDTPSSETAYSVPEVANEILVGDALTELQKLPANSVHTVLTSPPYPGSQRDYSAGDEEIGSEGSAKEYLESLLPIVYEALDVLRDDGTCWLVIDDCISDGSFSAVIDSLVAQIRSEGYVIFHNGPWVKSDGTLPDPAESRFSHEAERIIGIANTNDYYFDRYAVSDEIGENDIFNIPTSSGSRYGPPETGPEHDAMFSVELAGHILTAATPDSVCPVCGAPDEPVYEVEDVTDVTCTHREAVRENFHDCPDMTRKHAKACAAVGAAGAGQAKRTQGGSEKNSRSTRRLYREVESMSFPDSYRQCFSTARKVKTGTTRSCSCNTEPHEDDTGEKERAMVLDPFTGAGTTCVTADAFGAQYVGIELNEGFAKKAEAWLNKGISTPIYEKRTEEDTETSRQQAIDIY